MPEPSRILVCCAQKARSRERGTRLIPVTDRKIAPALRQAPDNQAPSAFTRLARREILRLAVFL